MNEAQENAREPASRSANPPLGSFSKHDATSTATSFETKELFIQNKEN